MKVHCLIRSQFLPIPQDVAWAFFANPANQAQLMPAWLHFQDESYEQARQVFAGMLRVHSFRLRGWLPVRWLLEITHLEAPNYLIEAQKVGPFAFWQHKHAVLPTEGGVELRDIVHYALPLGWLGAWFAVPVRLMLERLFDYREQMLEEFFGEG